MSLYINDNNKITDIFINPDGQKRKIKSMWCDKDGAVTKIFPSNNSSIKIVTWADGSWEQISAMLDAHYSGKIDIADYWSVGDERLTNLSAIGENWCPDRLTNNSSFYGEAQPEQSIVLTIIGFNHDNLETSVNGCNKAAITLQTSILQNLYGIDLYFSSIYYDIRYYHLNKNITYSWKDCERRIYWVNNLFKNSLPTKLQPMIKTVLKKYNNVYYKYSSSSTPDQVYCSISMGGTTHDDCFLLSCIEVGLNPIRDTSTFPFDDYYKYEGSTYDYYTIGNNRIKQNTRRRWYLRSPYLYNKSGNTNGCWCGIDKDGKLDYFLPDDVRGSGCFSIGFCI